MSQAGQFQSGTPGMTPVETITGNSGGPVPPSAGGNINLLGSGDVTVAGNAGTNTLTISLSGAVADSFPTDSGTAVPAAGALTIHGGNNIATSGAGSTVTIDLDGTTNHTLQIGNASGSLTSLGVATNGQLPIGSTGADPVLSTLTAGSGISITNGAGSITIAATSTSLLTYTLVNTTPYVVLAGDQYLGVDTTFMPITVQLPNAPSTGRVIVIKDRSGTAALNSITVTTVGGVVLIDGAATFVMNTAYEAIQVIFNGTFYEIF